jgi:predicted transcriptional regulator
MAMTLRLTDEQDKQLGEIAESLGISKNQAVASAVEAYISKAFQRVKIKQAFELVLERDADILAALGDD